MQNVSNSGENLTAKRGVIGTSSKQSRGGASTVIAHPHLTTVCRRVSDGSSTPLIAFNIFDIIELQHFFEVIDAVVTP